MSKRRRHWMDELADDLRERFRESIPAAAAAITDEVPYGYEPPKVEDEVNTFLHMNPQQRQMFFSSMPPEQYQAWSSGMMKKLNTRFGPASQVLHPMLQGAPVEALAQGVPLDQDASMGVAAAQADLAQLLGFDPLQ